ncbi:MAG: hypothetical protein HRT71_16020 [Flavobacteriales bacterium]|nr:hypothetical protein [Flavobacteriales bacterium]
MINRNAKINLFYEGLLSLNDYSEKFNSQHLKRIVGGLMVGILYKYNKTIYPYKNDRIHKIYTPLPELTLGERSKKISCAIRLKEHQNNKTNRCLILGGPIENILEYYKVFLKEIAEKSFSEIVYKGHPAFNTYRKDEKHTFRNLAAQHNVDFVEIHEDEIIEDVISKYPSKVIYSYPSSALINLKLIIDDSCEIKCYLHKDLVLDQNLHRIYKTINIKINPIY